MKNAKEIGAVKVITADLGEAGANELRSMCDKAKEQGDNIVAVFAGVSKEKRHRLICLLRR